MQAVSFQNCRFSVPPYIERVVWMNEINKPVRNSGPFFHRRLVGPDVHAAIDLTGISRQDFGGKMLSHLDRHTALSYRCGTQYHD
jgi:hypothetical protein